MLSTLIYYVLVFNSIVVLIAGLILAGMFATGRDTKQYWQRVIPATATIVITTLAAALVLYIAQAYAS